MRLTRGDVLAGAIELLDQVGVDELTMRRLAAHLGVQNGATYWHFKSKRALLDAIAEELVAGITDAPLAGSDWQHQLAEMATRLHQALLAHRDGARIYAGAFVPEPNALAYGEAMIAIMRTAGFDERTAAWSQDTLTSYVVAHAIEHQAAQRLTDRQQLIEHLRDALATGAYPNLATAEAFLAAPHPPDHFAHGLQLIISGLTNCQPATDAP